MAIEKVRDEFKRLGIDNRIMEFDSSSATVELASLAIGCKPEEIAKSLSFIVNDEPILVVTKGDARIDNQKFKAEFNEKAKMIKIEEVESFIGHAVGGVCPFAVNEGVKVYLDKSLKGFMFVYPACGSHNSAIKLTLAELEQYSHFVKYVDVCKD